MMDNKLRGIIVIVGAFLVQLTYGTTYTDGNMVPYLISYLHERVNPSTLASYTIFISTIHPTCQAALMVPSGYLEARIGTKLTAIISAIVMSGALLLTYFTIKISFALVFLTYGFLFGLGISMGYGCLISCCMKWFPKNRGLAGGIAVAGYGLGASIFNPIQSFMVNPENISPTKDGYFVDSNLLDRLPNSLIASSGIYLFLQVIGIFMISEPSDINKQETLDSSEESLTPLQALRTRELYILWFSTFCNGCTIVFLTPMYKAYGQSFIHDDHYLAFVGSIMSILNASGRLVWGVLMDRYAYAPCMRTVTTGIAILMFTMPVTPLGGKAMYTVWTAALFFFVSGTFVLVPSVSVTVFGTKHMTSNYGMLFSGMIAASAFMVVLTSMFLDKIGYNVMFFILGGISVLGMMMTFAYEHEREKRNANNNNQRLQLKEPTSDIVNAGHCDLSELSMKEITKADV